MPQFDIKVNTDRIEVWTSEDVFYFRKDESNLKFFSLLTPAISRVQIRKKSLCKQMFSHYELSIQMNILIGQLVYNLEGKGVDLPDSLVGELLSISEEWNMYLQYALKMYDIELPDDFYFE